MERFAVKRGVQKTMGGNAGLAKLATQYFEDINVDADGVFTGSYGLLVMVQGSFDSTGKLAVDVEQLKGSALGEFLEGENGREMAMGIPPKVGLDFWTTPQDILQNNVETRLRRKQRSSQRLNPLSKWLTRPWN